MHTMELNLKYPEQYDRHMVVSIPKVSRQFNENYEYYKGSIPYKVGRFFAYIGAYTIGYAVCLAKNGIRFRGRKNLSKYKVALAKGCVTICNHVFHYDYLSIMIGLRPHFTYYPAWNAKLLDKDRMLVNITGGIPLPSTINGIKPFFHAFDRHMDEGSWIHFFPEAAMWPYYQKIRPFKDGAFSLAEKHNSPILPMAFQFRNPGKLACFLGAKEPYATLHIGEPIFCDQSITNKKLRIEKLKMDSFRAVEKLAGVSESDW